MSKKTIKKTRESLQEFNANKSDRTNSYNELKASIKLYTENSKLSNDDKARLKSEKKLR